MPHSLTRASVGLLFGRFGSFGVAYTGINRPPSLPQQIFFPGFNPGIGVYPQTASSYFFVPAQHVQLVTASYTRQLFGSVYAYATGYYDFAQSHSAGAVIGISIPLGQQSSVNVSGGAGYQQGYGSIQAMRSVINPGDVGGQVMGTVGSPARQFAEFDYKPPWALLSAGADHSFGQITWRATAQGALSFVDGSLFASNTIYDSFAEVDTGGTKGIHVLQENRPIGTTDSAGQLLVPDLRSYDVNRIGIDPSDVPADANVGQTTQRVRPQDRSGVVVKFPIQASRGALLRLVDDADAPIPVGSAATLQETGATVPVGYDGEAFVQDLRARNTVTVTEPDGKSCVTSFAFRAQPGILPTIGPLRCRASGAR